MFAIDSYRVAKIHLGTPRSVDDFETEQAVYRRFNNRLSKIDCRYVLRCLDTENSRGLVFERCRQTLRSRIRKGVTEEAQVMRWARQAAKGLAWVHDCKVIQGDVGCHNMLLDSSENIKLADFAGSSIDDSEVSINYEVRSRLPDLSRPTKKSDIFALGSAMYEMATGHPPYQKLSYNTIQSLYRKGQFPEDVDGIPEMGKIIRKCWERRFDTAWDVVRALGETESRHRRSSQLRERSEVFIDSAISVADTPKPEIFAMERAPSRQRHGDVPTTYVIQTSQRRQKSRHEKYVESVPERQGKKYIHGPFSTWINKSIHSLIRPPRTTRERKKYY